MAKAEAMYAKCVAKCADEHVGLLKGVVSNIDSQLKELAKK